MILAPIADSSVSLLAQSGRFAPIAEGISLALLHFLWQGVLLAVAIAILLRIFRDSSAVHASNSESPHYSRATIRYRICCVGLIVMATLPIGNYLWISSSFLISHSVDSTSTVDARVGEVTADAVPPVATDDSGRAHRSTLQQDTNTGTLGRLSEHLSGRLSGRDSSFVMGGSMAESVGTQSIPLRRVFWSWLVGVIALSLWHVASWSITRRLTENTAEVPADLARMFAMSKRRLGLSRKRIDLRVSLDAWAPMVVGWLRPVILLPVSVLTALTPREMESILLHELAHVRRHDYTINLLQVAIETVLFFHPCVWWLSRRIRIEREYRADDVAVRFGAGPDVYVHSLLRIAETCRTPTPTVTVAATGGSLADRAARLLGVSSDADRRRHRAGNALLALAVGISVTLAGVAGVVTMAEQAAPISSEEETPEDEASAKEPPAKEPPAKEPPAPWGSIRGRFLWDGMIPELPKFRNTKDVVALGESISDESLLVDPKTRGVKNIAVYVRDKRLPVHADYEKTAKDVQSFTYRGVVSPRVLALRTTQKLDLLNRDPVAHSALFEPLANAGKHVLVPPNANLKIDFPVAERVPLRVRDAIHPWVHAHLIVTDHPYVAITDRDGNFELKNLPAQEVELQFWHEKTGYLAARPHWERGRKKITVRAGETFDLGDVVVPTAAFGIQPLKEPALQVGAAYVVILDNGLVHQGVLAAVNKETIRLLSDDKFIEIDRENVEEIRPRKR